MMKKDKSVKLVLAVLVGCMSASTVLAAGFGLYEMSARATGMGGHVFGRPVDASANYYNPAGLSSMSGTVVTVGFSTLHPRLDTSVNGKSTHKMDPGCFFVPNAFISQELPYDLTFGLGIYADYGLGSHYHNTWPLSFDSVESKFAAYTLNPNLSYRITPKWSVAAGLRLTHATFDQRRYVPTDLSALGMGTRRMRLKFEADNDVDVGWQLGTQYEIAENLSVGAVYRSRLRLALDGDCKSSGVPGHVNTPMGRIEIGDKYRGDFEEKLDLPSSAILGVNWDIIKPLHFGTSLTWTEWSTVDQLDFVLPAGRQRMDLGWHDAWRTGFGFAYDFTDDVTGMLGYIYDWDPTREKRPATMLPCGDRHIIHLGAAYTFGRWQLSCAYALVIMECKTMYFNFNNEDYKFQTDNPYTHYVGVSLSCHF